MYQQCSMTYNDVHNLQSSCSTVIGVPRTYYSTLQCQTSCFNGKHAQMQLTEQNFYYNPLTFRKKAAFAVCFFNIKLTYS